jgi:catechol 2,3-dioxygenase-like lactoylglutathione lyase family enzyme
MKFRLSLGLVLSALMPMSAFAQLAPPNVSGVAMGHVHLNVSDVNRNRQLWVDAFGATPITREGLSGVKLPGLVVLFSEQKPSGETHGTAVDHFGLKVRSRAHAVDIWRKAGQQVTREFLGSEGNLNAHLITPDGVDVEVTEVAGQGAAASGHHLHFAAADYLAERDWYVRTFAAAPRKRGAWETADVPGINLSFMPPVEGRAPLAPTRGRAVDHIGFEVKNLQEFCRQLEAKGVRFERPYSRDEKLGLGTAVLSAPAGTLIELTEGLGRY